MDQKFDERKMMPGLNPTSVERSRRIFHEETKKIKKKISTNDGSTDLMTLQDDLETRLENRKSWERDTPLINLVGRAASLTSVATGATAGAAAGSVAGTVSLIAAAVFPPLVLLSAASVVMGPLIGAAAGAKADNGRKVRDFLDKGINGWEPEKKQLEPDAHSNVAGNRVLNRSGPPNVPSYQHGLNQEHESKMSSGIAHRINLDTPGGIDYTGNKGSDRFIGVDYDSVEPPKSDKKSPKPFSI